MRSPRRRFSLISSLITHRIRCLCLTLRFCSRSYYCWAVGSSRYLYSLLFSALLCSFSTASLFCFSLLLQSDPRSGSDTTTLHMYITVLYSIPFHLLNFIIVLPRGPTPSIGIQHRTSRSYPQPDLWVRGFTHSRNPSPRSRLLGPTPIYFITFVFLSIRFTLHFRLGGEEYVVTYI